MSILIRGMEMPEHCGYCRFRYDGICHALQKTQYSKDECPLSYVPPYTRLIDAETLYCRLVNEPIRAVDGIPFDADWWTRITDAYEQAIDAVEQAPTIIEAEGEDT